jgi:lantibiotic transport system ATP-binding protein
MPWAIHTENLSHRFGDVNVLHKVALRVPRGSVYGLLGPNGAGKTTLMRLLLGLLGVQQGRIDLLGEPLLEQRLALMARVGSAIEFPALYPKLSAAENLRLWQLVHQAPKSRVKAVLAQVGLAHAGSRPVAQFSLGMKQRLALGIALLHQPELLILDEPNNGLDPQGMVETRALLKQLSSEQGVTVLVSSHALHDLAKLADHAGVLVAGCLRYQGPMTELLARGEDLETIFLELCR